MAATGPSLTDEVAAACAGMPVVAVNDAYRLFPAATVLYACDAQWWKVHDGCPSFRGEKWSSQGAAAPVRHNDKRDVAARYRLNLVLGQDREGFSLDPEIIHYGSNSGFQAINLALLMGATRIVLVGFDMRVGAKRHFFGDHPVPLRNSGAYTNFIRAFDRAATLLPPDIEILNATPGSALTCFRMVDLHDAFAIAA